MEPPQIIELRQDRNLIKSNFDGYKLSLEPVAIIKQELQSAPLRAKNSDEQYSFLHVELFSLHNHLIQDPWDPASAYFVNERGSIEKCTYSEATGRPKPPAAVYKLPAIAGRQPGDYNISLCFVSEKFAVLCDGCNQIVLFDTSDRCKSAEWKVVFKSSIADDRNHFLLREARLDITAERKTINFVLQRVENLGDDIGNMTQLLCYVLIESAAEKSWSLVHRETLQGKGSVEYCALEPKSSALIVSSNKPFKFQSNRIDEPEETTMDDAIEPKKAVYSWSQTDEDIVVKFACRPQAEKNDYKVTCSKEKLLVKCRDDTLLEEALFGKVDTDLTTWTLENDFLQLTLVKDISSLHWPFLVPDGPKECSDVEQNDITVPAGQPVSNLEAQMEECDHPIQSIEDDFYIERLDLTAKQPTHRIVLGTWSPLFSTNLRAGFPAAIATRQDVDTCLWLLQLNPSNPENWSLRHEGTLHAFGYVEASKQQKKFVNCSPDMSYAVICESFRHVFIYKSTYDTTNSLRNRNGPQISIGKQHVVTLEDAGEVLGMAVDNAIITLLTEKFLLYLQVNVG